VTVPGITVHRAKFCSADGFVYWADDFICSAEGSICCSDGFRCSAGALRRSIDGLICPADGFCHSIDGLLYFTDGLICSADGFICSVEARNWWIGATTSIDAVNITFRGGLKTYAEAAICCIGVKLTAAGPGKCSFLPNFVVGSPPRRSNGAKNIVDRANKTVARAKKTIGDGRMLLGLGAKCPSGMLV
jgi:hypothetical protein